jgi:hypothetical protein
MRSATIGLGFVMIFGMAAASAPAAYGQSAEFAVGDPAPLEPVVNEMEFKLRAGGQIDFDAGTMELAGQSTHIGQFTSQGTFDAATWSYSGLLFDANGAFANVEIVFVAQTPGEYAVTISFLGIRSHSVILGGFGTGTAHMDPDFMFTLNVEGRFRKCLARKCLG